MQKLRNLRTFYRMESGAMNTTDSQNLWVANLKKKKKNPRRSLCNVKTNSEI